MVVLDIEMPESCRECKMFDDDIPATCTATGLVADKKFVPNAGRMRRCPIVCYQDSYPVSEEEMCRQIINWYREDKQVTKACEELSELLDVLLKGMTRPDGIDRKNLVEEMADVQIMMMQLKMLFSIDDEELARMRRTKLDRTNKRIMEDISNRLSIEWARIEKEEL